MYERYICQKCGAHLDPGERCDCDDKKSDIEEMYNNILSCDEEGQMILREVLV